MTAFHRRQHDARDDTKHQPRSEPAGTAQPLGPGCTVCFRARTPLALRRVLHVFLGRRDIPADKTIHSRFAHLEGTMLMMDDTQGEVVLITAYRNRRGLRRLRAKAKYDCCDGQGRPRPQVWDDRPQGNQS